MTSNDFDFLDFLLFDAVLGVKSPQRGGSNLFVWKSGSEVSRSLDE